MLWPNFELHLSHLSVSLPHTTRGPNESILCQQFVTANGFYICIIWKVVMKHGETEGRVQTEDEDTASQPSVLDPYMSHIDNDYSDYSVV